MTTLVSLLPGPTQLPVTSPTCNQRCPRTAAPRVGGWLHERYPKPAELNKTSRQQRDEVPRHRLRRLVTTAAGTASNEQDFLHRLRASGLLVRPRANTTDPTQTGGYAVALPDERNAAGDTIWYSGSTLAAGLSLPNLRHRWRSP